MEKQSLLCCVYVDRLVNQTAEKAKNKNGKIKQTYILRRTPRTPKAPRGNQADKAEAKVQLFIWPCPNSPLYCGPHRYAYTDTDTYSYASHQRTWPCSHLHFKLQYYELYLHCCPTKQRDAHFRA